MGRCLQTGFACGSGALTGHPLASWAPSLPPTAEADRRVSALRAGGLLGVDVHSGSPSHAPGRVSKCSPHPGAGSGLEGDRDPCRTRVGVVTSEQGRESRLGICERIWQVEWRRALQVVGPVCAKVQK